MSACPFLLRKRYGGKHGLYGCSVDMALHRRVPDAGGDRQSGIRRLLLWPGRGDGLRLQVDVAGVSAFCAAGGLFLRINPLSGCLAPLHGAIVQGRCCRFARAFERIRGTSGQSRRDDSSGGAGAYRLGRCRMGCCCGREAGAGYGGEGCQARQSDDES